LGDLRNRLAGSRRRVGHFQFFVRHECTPRWVHEVTTGQLHGLLNVADRREVGFHALPLFDQPRVARHDECVATALAAFEEALGCRRIVEVSVEDQRLEACGPASRRGRWWKRLAIRRRQTKAIGLELCLRRLPSRLLWDEDANGTFRLEPGDGGIGSAAVSLAAIGHHRVPADDRNLVRSEPRGGPALRGEHVGDLHLLELRPQAAESAEREQRDDQQTYSDHECRP
jgi:hypothetical protein